MSRWGALAAVVVVSACSTYRGADEPGDAAVDSGDAGADAAGPALGPNVLSNGDFELGCASWQGDNATLTESTTAHGGTRACLVCVKSTTDPVFQVFNTASVTPVVGQRWIAELWLEVAGTGGSPSEILLVAQAHTSNGNAVDNGITTGPALDGTWKHVTAILDIDKPAIDLSLLVKATLPASKPTQCFLVDDATLRLQPP